ncbi:ComEA family DNA-binding protein [Thiomicrorhabdus aquaedulcis]|uniref:ComEA family DNA-binding protein n=1 Tax=Thiomicrorhabdus aquaedulcis TaxID=2211106 RepID=UPI001561F4AB|nr:helix-hairpin-helix domain-containing protein [Thiomicrorhabdus aquaedulcis]
MLLKSIFKSGFLVALLSISSGVLASPINVNTATPAQISEALNGIGPAKAEAISALCKATPCTKPEDLLAVKGIGEKTLEKIKADLLFTDAPVKAKP